MGKKKWTDKQKEMALARLMLGDSPVAISRDLGIPRGTVRHWKSILPTIQEEEGSLAHQSEEVRKFSDKGWRIINKGLKRIEEGLDDVTLKKPYDFKQIATIIGILYDKVIRALPQAGPPKPRPIDLSNVSTESLRVMIVDLQRTVQAAESGEIIEGEVKEISGGE